MSQPVYVRKSLTVGAVALLHAVAPSLIVGGGLYITAAVHGVPFTDFFLALAILASVLAALIIRVPSSGGSVAPIDDIVVQSGRILFRWFVVLGILFAVAYATKFSDQFSRRVVLTWAFVTPAFLILGQLFCNALIRRTVLSEDLIRSAVVIGFNQPGQALASRIIKHPELCMRMEGFFDDRAPERLGDMGNMPLLGKLADVNEYARKNNVDVIFVALPMRHVQRVLDLLDQLQDTTVSIYYVPDYFVFDLIQSRTHDVMGVPVVSLCETPLYGYRGVVKRISDVLFTGMLLIPLLPVMATIAVAIKLTSAGPVIFRQDRYGLDGQKIIVYKFRSMTVTENGETIRQATREDPRLTPIGGFLRRYSLDELPQLFNVLQGRMSLVGPRPHAVAHNEEYRSQIKGYMIRHKVLPGITGLAQVNGCRGETRNLGDMEARIRYDLAYLKNWTPLLDVKILLATVVRIWSDRRAY